MQDLALEAQRAGYSVLIYFTYFANAIPIYVPSKEILLIPVLEASLPQLYKNNSAQCILLANGDRPNVEISVQVDRPSSNELDAVKSYFEKLYF